MPAASPSACGEAAGCAARLLTLRRPENALKRAEELINCGQPNAALQALHDVVTSKRHRTWTKTSEKVMFKFVECVP